MSSAIISSYNDNNYNEETHTTNTQEIETLEKNLEKQQKTPADNRKMLTTITHSNNNYSEEILTARQRNYSIMSDSVCQI